MNFWKLKTFQFGILQLKNLLEMNEINVRVAYKKRTICLFLSIHPIIYIIYRVKGCWGLAPVPCWEEMRFPLVRVPGVLQGWHSDKQPLTLALTPKVILESPINLTPDCNLYTGGGSQGIKKTPQKKGPGQIRIETGDRGITNALVHCLLTTESI